MPKFEADQTYPPTTRNKTRQTDLDALRKAGEHLDQVLQKKQVYIEEIVDEFEQLRAASRTHLAESTLAGELDRPNRPNWG